MFTREMVAAELDNRKIEYSADETDAQLAHKLVAALEAEKVEVAPELLDLALSDTKKEGQDDAAQADKPEDTKPEPKEEEKPKPKTRQTNENKAAAKQSTPPAEPTEYTMLCNVTHDGVQYVKGQSYELSKDMVKLFRKEKFIA